MPNTMGLKGVDKVKGKLTAFARQFPDHAAQALRIETEIEATECKRRTPVDTGALRASIHVEGPDREYRTLRTSIVAGGVAAPYAIIVHEDLEAFHKVGQAKYIESVILESRPYMADRIAKRIDFAKLG